MELGIVKAKIANYAQIKNVDVQVAWDAFFFSRLKMEKSYPNGESPNDFYIRIKSSFIDLVRMNKDKKILLVTHGGVITVITCLIFELAYSNLPKFNIPFASITKFK